MNIITLKRENLINDKFRTQFFNLLNTTELSQQDALSVLTTRANNVITFIGINEKNTPLATASLILERKFIRNGMTYGHIEDVNVHQDHRHQKLGTEIMTHIMKFAEKNTPCKKIVLECTTELKTFYQNHKFKTIGISMKYTSTELKIAEKR